MCASVNFTNPGLLAPSFPSRRKIPPCSVFWYPGDGVVDSSDELVGDVNGDGLVNSADTGISGDTNGEPDAEPENLTCLLVGPETGRVACFGVF